MSNTPLEQNSVDLATVLNMINNLPEYSEVPLSVKVDIFTAYNAAMIKEITDSINLANDTEFDTSVSYTADTVIRTATTASTVDSNRKVLIDLENYTYITTAEYYVVPEYSPQPTNHFFVGCAGMEIKIYSKASPNPITFTVYRNKLNATGTAVEDTGQMRGFQFGVTGFASYSSETGYLSLIQPALSVRPNDYYASPASLQQIDTANTSIGVRQRVFRVQNDQFIGKMRSVSNNMITYASFEEDFPNES